MKQFFLIGFFSFAILILSGSSAAASGQTITGSIGNGTAERGSSTRATVVVNIPGGLHVNSNRPSSKYSIPTTIRVSGTGIKTGGVNYPRGHNRKFAFSENLINVYEGRTVFPIKVKVPANFRGNVVRLRAVVKYQACTEEVCYPPKTKEITLTARVR
jgi:DsbC/DsbD-like thiol-disulfide interchange protein